MSDEPQKPTGLAIGRNVPFMPCPTSISVNGAVSDSGERFVSLTVETPSTHLIVFFNADMATQVASHLDRQAREARRPVLVRPPSNGLVVPPA